MTPDRVAAALVALALFALTAIVFLRRGTRDVSARGTITVFAFVWAISLAAYALPWIRYSRPDVLAWAIVYGSIVGFLAASFVVEQIARTPKAPSGAERLAPPRLHLAIVLTAALGYIGFAFFLRAVNRTVGWTTLFTNLHAVRQVEQGNEFSQQYGAVKVLTYFSAISLLLWTLAVREGTFRGKARALAPLGFLVVVPYFFLGERLSLLTVLIWVSAFHLLWRPVRFSRRVGLLVLATTLAGLGFFFLIGYNKGATIQNHPEIETQLTTQHFRQFAFAYLYLSANVPVLSKLMDDPLAPRTHGELTAWPGAKLSSLVLKRPRDPPKYGAFYDIPFNAYNSATWLGPFYLDFGPVGSILLPAAFGAITTLLLVRARTRRTLLTVWLAAAGLMIIAFSPLKNAFSDASTWEFIIMAPVTAFVVRDRTLQSEHVGDSVGRRRWPMYLVFGLAGLIVGVLGVVAVRHYTSSSQNADSNQALYARLSNAGGKVAQAFNKEGSSSPRALATRLSVSDPHGTYEGTYDPRSSPRPGVVDVFSNEREFRLRARTSGGAIVEVVGVRRNGRYQLVGPQLIQPGLVSNGGFEDASMDPWVVATRAGVSASVTTEALDGAYSLKLQYSGHRAGRPTSVSQLIRSPSIRAAGTRYLLHQQVRTHNLSRQVTCGFQVIYRDGTSMYFPGTLGSKSARSNAEATGVLAGSRPKTEITASGVAPKPVAAIRVFAVDAGTAPVQGVIVVDDVELRATPHHVGGRKAR